MFKSVALVGKELVRVGSDRVRPGGSTLPDRGQGLTPEFIEVATGQAPGTVRSVRVLDENHGTAGRVRIAVDAPGGELPETLFVKVSPRNTTQRLMMNLFDLGEREALFYRTIAPEAPLRIPRCYAVQIDRGRGRNVIILEDLAAANFRDIRHPASAEEAGAVVEALADLHAAYWQSPRLDGDLSVLQARDPAAEKLGNLFVGKVLGNLKGHNAELIPEDLGQKGRIAFERRGEIDALWARGERTVCHGDTHFGNLFFEGDRPGFLDWQAVMVGPPLRDISYFLIASTDSEVLAVNERDLVARYVARLSERGIELDGEDAWNLYRATAVEIYVAAVVTAGTSDRMQPPEISRVGVQRVVAATQRLETFDVLEAMLDATPI